MSKYSKNYASKSGKTYTIHGGKGTVNYTFSNEKGQKSILGFDSSSEVKSYIDKRDSGNKHFMDLID